ncbi:DUF2339 domain-containing protein [Nitrospirillum viridazoti]|uniref:DUF2339 domain-containing protein n=1 Tax=Nitrospirillum viridazoti CBAmc TaxID=1441467 RepID=A0A248JVE3_9PROT|nr:DUF2339 domain-containing protein [Nitrospirillum amazonense]ASG22098.1 hypothetical protein Y958_14025 [Nitrospirillum amazonense CBAmc]TWB32769.1 putative membrane protein [Nitrospirillum amazonense]
MAFLVFIALMVALWALIRSEKSERRLAELNARLEALAHRLSHLEGGAPPARPAVAPPPALPASGPPPGPVAPPSPAPIPKAASQPAYRPAAPSLEQALGTRWLVWLGALAVALAGVFLAKYAVDQGLLGPAVRLTLGGLFGAALVTAGDVMRGRAGDTTTTKAPLPAASIPAALTAAGLAIAFACVYAAHALHGLIGPGATFAGLGALSAVAFLLALRHGGGDGLSPGAFIALLGLGGGLAVPALVPSDHPSAWALFGYLALLNTATLAVSWRLPAAWLGLPVLAGAALWVVTAAAHTVEATPIVLFLVALSAAGLGFGLLDLRRERPIVTDAWIVAALGGLPMVLDWLLLVATDYDAAGVAGLAALALLAVAAARAPSHRPEVTEALAPIAALLATLALAQGYTVRTAGLSYPVQLGVAAAFGLGFAAAGLRALTGTHRLPRAWAWGAALPLVGLAWAGWTFDHTGALPDLAWAGGAVALAGGMAWAAAWAGRPDRPQPVPGAFVLAALALAGLALAALLRTSWLTAALSLLVPAAALIENRTTASPLANALRRGAVAVAVVVVARLTLNPWLLDYPLNGTSPLNWLLWGYGVPAVACTAGTWLLRQRRDDRPAQGLAAAALVLGLLFACLEIQVMQTGSLASDPFALLPTSLRSVLFLAVALVLTGRVGNTAGPVTHPVAHWGARILVRVAAAQVVLVQLGVLNPLWAVEPVGPWPVFNLLLLVYALPALMFGLAAWRREAGLVRRALVILVLVLAFTWVSLEVRQAFHGSTLTLWAHGGERTDAEWYSYSAAWLAFALVLLALGVRTRRADLRYASLAVLLVTVLKVFLSDMADLTGLLRILSFLGLGLCLMGIGYVYQRVVFAPARVPANPMPGETP